MKAYFPILKYFIIGVELIFVGNITYLHYVRHSLATEKTLYQIILFLMIQNGLLSLSTGIICFCIWEKNKEIVKTSPFCSFVIVNKSGKKIREVFLEDKKSFFLVKKNGKELICIETGQTDFREPIYAVFNLFEGNWYIENVSEQYPIGIRRGEEAVIYRLKNNMPYRLCPSDIIYMDSTKILIKERNCLEG